MYRSIESKDMRNDLKVFAPLTTEDLQKITPSVFAEAPSEKMSSKYTFVPTIQVVQDMISLGWQIGNAFEVKARKDVGFQKHCVEFFRPDLVIEREGETLYPTVILKNSHNGSSTFEFRVGIYRLVCSNGLVIADTEFGKINLKHLSYSFGELAESMFKFISTIDEVIGNVGRLMEKELTSNEAIEFAEKASKIRLLENQSMSIDQVLGLLEIRRNADKGLNLWKILNRVQENIIKGSYFVTTYNAEKNAMVERKARAIKNFDLDLEYNTKLWNLANAYV